MFTILFLFFGTLAFAQTDKKEVKSDSIECQLNPWEWQQLRNFEKIEQRKAEIVNLVNAMQRELDLLNDKENVSWDAIYNSHKEVDRNRVIGVKFLPDRGLLKLKMRP